VALPGVVPPAGARLIPHFLRGFIGIGDWGRRRAGRR
jgi:hypothetical protein